MTKIPVKSTSKIDFLDFAGSHVAVIRESVVRKELPPKVAIAELRSALRSKKQRQNLPRFRLESGDQNHAWLHTLRGRFGDFVGGKDYTSLGFKTPALWLTIVNAKSGLPVALIEADYLSRVRTAAVTALATDLMADTHAKRLAHFGAGKVSKLLIELILHVRADIEEINIVRRKTSLPEWASIFPGVRLIQAREAVEKADVITTATNSKAAVLCADFLKSDRKIHINLVGSNHLKRSEMDISLAERAVVENALVVDDREQCALEAGDFQILPGEKWDDIPSLDGLINSPELQTKMMSKQLTVFKTVGVGLMDVILGTALLQRLGIVSEEGKK